jgi:hypothetical protein
VKASETTVREVMQGESSTSSRSISAVTAGSAKMTRIR